MKTQCKSDARLVAPHYTLRGPTLPSVFTVELTTACNNFCSGCANVELSRSRAGRKNTLAYMTRWQEVLDKIAASKTANTIVRFSGGEPTLHPAFARIIEYADGKGIPFAVLSTGRWTKLRPPALITALRNRPNFLGFLVSLHGSDAGTHCAFVESPPKVFDETCRNIRTAAQAGLRVFTNTVITCLNYNNVEKIVALSEALGAGHAVFNRFVAAAHPLLPAGKELSFAVETVNYLRKSGRKCRIGNSLPKCFSPHNAYPAPAGYELCHISPSGKVRPDNFTHFSFGNIFDQSIQSIWQSDKAVFYRNYLPDTCTDCAALNSCRGGLKSLHIGTGRPVGDPLMLAPVSFEEIRFWDDDKDKSDPVMLALTSD